MEPLLAPFRYQFMQTGLLAVILVGVTCATVGVYVVLRRMAFIGDALAHTMLPGLVGAHDGTRVHDCHRFRHCGAVCLLLRQRHFRSRHCVVLHRLFRRRLAMAHGEVVPAHQSSGAPVCCTAAHARTTRYNGRN